MILCLLICLGAWTRIRSRTTNSHLAAVGFAHGLNTYMIRHPVAIGVPSTASMATTVEAILGAVALDGGADAFFHVANLLGLVHELITPVMSSSYFPHILSLRKGITISVNDF